VEFFVLRMRRSKLLTGLGVDPIPEGYLLPQPNRPDASRSSPPSLPPAD
jgi:hypothetical protein